MRRFLLLLPLCAHAVQNATDDNDCEDPSLIIKRHAWTQTMTLHPRSGHVRRTGGISLFRKNAKASSGWVQKYLEKELVNTTTIATRQHERKLWHDHRHVSYRQLFWVQEALGFDPNCFPTFERHKVFLATVLRKPLDRAVAAFHAQPSHREGHFGETWEKWSSRGANPPLFLASRMSDNYFVRAFTARCPQHYVLDLETCLRGCPVRREPVTTSDLETARRALERFDLILFSEALPGQNQQLRDKHAPPRLSETDAALVRQSVRFDDALYAWAWRRRAARCGGG